MLMGMWEPFTDSARRSIVLAQEEAQKLGSNRIGTEHLLLGIAAAEGDNDAARALFRFVEYSQICNAVEAITGDRSGDTFCEMIFTLSAKRAIELAFIECRALHRNCIATSLLLLGILGVTDASGARVLANLGVDKEKLRAELVSGKGPTS
jgi:ATP-dependent Clp protease ATP-binding subunit ClpC